jgi:hypothetical protein
MTNLARKARPLAVVLAYVLLWGSFAWGLPADPPAAEGEAETSPPAEAAPPEPPAEPSKWTGWFYAGLGYGSPGYAANASANVKYGRYLGILRGAFSAAGFFEGDEVRDIGLLAGWYPLKYFSVAAGFAWVGGHRWYPDGWFGTTEPFSTLGIPIEVQFSPLQSRIIGLGVNVHGNISEEPFGGVTVGIQLGKLK